VELVHLLVRAGAGLLALGAAASHYRPAAGWIDEIAAEAKRRAGIRSMARSSGAPGVRPSTTSRRRISWPPLDG